MRARDDRRAALMFLGPYGLLFLGFVVGPLLYGFWISLHKWHILDANAPFVGALNYRNVLGDELFRTALARTAWFVLLSVPLGNLLSLLLASGLNANYRGTTFLKVAFYLPVVVSVSVLAVVWRWVLNPDAGLLNYAMGTNINWLGSPAHVMPAIALMSIWWGAGGNMLVYLAALKAVPKEQLEAASLDGAGSLRKFFAVTLPSIRPALLFCLVLSVIGASQVFGQTYLLTGGGPAFSSLTVVLYMYQQGFGQYQLGYASAVAYVLFAVVFGFTMLQFRVMRKSLATD